MSHISFALLYYEEISSGRAALKKCLEARFKPKLIIQNKGNEIARKKFQIYEQSLSKPLEKTEVLLKNYECQDVINVTVDNHNSPSCQSLLEHYPVDFIFTVNTCILKPYIFKTSKKHSINIHPGMLPNIKGSLPVIWSLYEKEELGCTAHIIEEGLDSGAIILKTPIVVTKSDTIESLIEKSIYLSGNLIINVLSSYKKNRQLTTHHQKEQGKTFKYPNQTIIDQAKENLIALQKKL